MGAIANNSEHNSFEMPYRDFLKKNSTSPSGAEWSSPWDDMTTAYGSQFPVLIGTAGITWELPVYSDVTAERVVPYGLMRLSTDALARPARTVAKSFSTASTLFFILSS